MEKNIEMMKKLIEEKKKKGENTKNTMRASKTIGHASNAKRSKKGGGFFDK